MDEIVREFGSWRNEADAFKAGKIAVGTIRKYFEDGESFNQEVTLCGNSVWSNIVRARELGYQIEMYYVGVDSVDIAKVRIASRVLKGGHGIPDADVERRFSESIRNLPKAIVNGSGFGVEYIEPDYNPDGNVDIGPIEIE